MSWCLPLVQLAGTENPLGRKIEKPKTHHHRSGIRGIPDETVALIKRDLLAGDQQRIVAERYGVHRRRVEDIHSGRCYFDVVPAPDEDEDAFLKKIFRVADEHAEATCEPDHTVGDLQDHLRNMWALLTKEQRQKFINLPATQELLEMGFEDEDSDG